MFSSKDALRQAMLKIRNSLPVELLDGMSEEIQNKIIGMNEFTRANTVAAYHSIGSEVRTSRILNAVLQMNKRLVLPKVVDETRIIFAEIKDLNNDLQVGMYNIMEPKEHCSQVENIDLILVPGIAWDEHGHRVGYGQGYYDRYLTKINTFSIGLAYELQVFEEIQHGKNDFRVNMLVTDKRIIRTK